MKWMVSTWIDIETNKAAMVRYKRCSYSERCIVYCYKVRYTKKCKLHFCTWWALNGTFISQLRSKIEAHQSARTRRHTVTCLRRSWAESADRGRGLEGKGVEGWRCCCWCGCWSRSGVARCHWAEPRGSTGQGGVINKARQRKSRRSNDGRQDVPQQ